MVTAIPISARMTIVNGKERYTNNNIKPSADVGSLLTLARALNSLQYNAPADKFIVSRKHELRGE